MGVATAKSVESDQYRAVASVIRIRIALHVSESEESASRRIGGIRTSSVMSNFDSSNFDFSSNVVILISVYSAAGVGTKDGRTEGM